MNIHQLFFIITISIITTLAAMEQEKPLFVPTVKPIPSLQTICARNIVSGYGETDTERKNNSAQLISALQTGQHKSTLCASENVINDLQQKYIGRHGWKKPIDKHSITTKRTHKISTDFLVPHPTEKDLYIISNTQAQYALHILNITTGEIVQNFCGPQGTTLCCTTTDDEKIIVSGSFDGLIKIWDINTTQARHTFPQFTKSINRVATSHDNLISMSYESHEIKIWDLLSGAYKKSIITATPPRSLVTHNNTIYIGVSSGEILLADPRLPAHSCITQAWKGHANSTECLAISKHNDTLLSSGPSGCCAIRRWDVRNLKTYTQLFYIGSSDCITNIHETHDGKKLFVTNKKSLFVWDILQDSLLIASRYRDDFIHSNCMSMNEDETELHIGTYNRTGTINTIVPNCTFDELINSNSKS